MIPFKVFIYTVIFLILISVGVYVYKEREKSIILSEIEDRIEEEISIVEEEREAKYEEFDNIIEGARDSLKNSLNYSRYLTRKIKGYEENPSFDNFDLYERAKHISNYKYERATVQQRN